MEITIKADERLLRAIERLSNLLDMQDKAGECPAKEKDFSQRPLKEEISGVAIPLTETAILQGEDAPAPSIPNFPKIPQGKTEIKAEAEPVETMEFAEFQRKVIETCDAKSEGKTWVAKCLQDMGVGKLSDLKPEMRLGFLEVIKHAE